MSAPQVPSQDEVRRYNLSRVLRRIHVGGPATRSELVAFSGLNRSTVGALVAELSQFGLVEERTGVGGGVGRPSLIVTPVPSGAVTLAFDFRVERIVGAAVGLSGEVLTRRDEPHQRTGYTPEAAVAKLADMAQSMLEDLPVGALWVGTGVGMPGLVDAVQGTVRRAPNLNWIDVPLGPMLTDALRGRLGDAPVTAVGNDADLGALAEHARGSGAGAANVVYICGEIGVGGGIVLNGQLMSGAGGFGGEIGHMVVKPNGPRCECGSRGCWETLIGRDAVIRSAGREVESADVADIVAAAQAGDAKARKGLDTVGSWLGLGLRNLVNIFNPDVIVLGGQLGTLLPELADTMNSSLETSFRASLEQARIEVSTFGADSTLMGAAEMAFSHLLSNPLEALEASSELVAN